MKFILEILNLVVFGIIMFFGYYMILKSLERKCLNQILQDLKFKK